MLLLALACSALAGTTLAATMPDELIGHWCSSSFNFTISKKGLAGSADSEGYGCDLRNITEVEADTWKANYSCEGEFGRVKVSSLIRLETLNGRPYLATADSVERRDAKKGQVNALSIFYKCD